MDNGKKNSLKVLSTNDIRTHARGWTLAGDVGLLAHLEQFSENVINKTEETQANFNELVDEYEELYTRVGNITNQFLALQNCQFVENRVYDEETPTEEKQEVKVQNEADQEKLLLTQYKEAVEVGIKLLDTHFQEVQLPPNSDSDEEDEVSTGNSIIWKPKNPYAGKKFPFLIGSSEWWADDNVGLRPNKESFDTEKIASESESDMESLKSVEKTMKSSSSSSMENIKSTPIKPTFMESTEDLFGFDKNNDEYSKGSNSLPEESVNFLPDFDKEPEIEWGEPKKRGESSEERKSVEEKPNQDEIPPSKPKKVDNDFTRELMAKLVSVTNNGVERKKSSSKNNNNNTSSSKKVEKEKVEEVPKEPRTEDSLFDETDDGNDLFSGTTISRGAEDGKKKTKGLFFEPENDDELFNGENDLFSGSSTLFESEEFKKPEMGKNDLGVRGESKSASEIKKETIPPPPHKKNLVQDLFDDLDDDEDNLFAAKPLKQKSTNDKSSAPMEKDKVKESVTAEGIDWETDDGLFDTINTKIQDDFFTSSDLFHNKRNQMESKKTDTKPDFPISKEPQSVIKPEKKVEEPPKKDSSSLFDSHIAKPATGKDALDDPFGFSSGKDSGYKKISILNSDEEEEEDDLFSKSFAEGKKPAPTKTTTSAPDIAVADIEDDDTALFGEKPKPPDTVSVSSSRSSLFDDVSASKTRLASVFEKEKPTRSEETITGDGKPGRDLFSTKGRGEKSLLFDDDDDGDDLFSVGTKTGTKPKALPFEKTSSEPQKPESFLGDFEDNDLFKSFSPPTKLRETKSDILRHSELFGDDSPDGENLFDKSTASKPKPPNSLILKPKEIETKSQTVRKLNIPDNLKVKFESAAKKISPGGAAAAAAAAASTSAKPTQPAEKKPEEEKMEDLLEEPLQVSALLKCPSKDRVKIPGKRRPQSRRARQEAIRNSGNWDQQFASNSGSNLSHPEAEKQQEQQQQQQQQQQTKTSPVKSNPLSPSTDEEDFFKVPELDKNFEKEDQSIFKRDVFESSKSSKPEDSLLFDGAPVLSPVSPKKPEKPGTETFEKKTPGTEKLFETMTPGKGTLFETKSRETEKLFETKAPGTEKLLESMTPDKETLLQRKTPKTEKLFETKPLETEKLFETKTPEKTKLFEEKSPETEKLFETKSPEREKLFETKPPGKVKLFKEKTPETERLFETKTPETEKIFEAKTPVTEKLFETKTPETEEKSKKPETEPLFRKREPEAETLFQAEKPVRETLLLESGKPETGTLFGTEENAETDSLFGEEKPETGRPLFGKGKPKVGSIFDDEDDLNGEDEESLFKTSKRDTRTKKIGEKKKKPLFELDLGEEDDDEEDLFGGGKTEAPPSRLPVPEKRKEDCERKEKANSSFVDPLGLMTNIE